MFELQGHRGVRGGPTENSLSAFEAALDACVGSIETDVHLSADEELVLSHDPIAPGSTDSGGGGGVPPLIRSLPLSELRQCIRGSGVEHASGDPAADALPAARAYATERVIEAKGVVTLGELIGFCSAYAGAIGRQTGKSQSQREAAARVLFDLELKRVPFHPEFIGDGFDGRSAGKLETELLRVLQESQAIDKARVRSFDHRALRAIRQLEEKVEIAMLMAATAPVDIPALARAVDASVYCPDYRFLDRAQMEQCHGSGLRVIPWTVNEAAAWERLLEWGVDGITTDVPAMLALFLKDRGIVYQAFAGNRENG